MLLGAKRITPSRLHEPPAGLLVPASISTEPPSISIRLRLLPAKNPMERLSGDQNGQEASSVPASGRAEIASSERSNNCDRPSVIATKTIFFPSGEIASDAGFAAGGVLISVRVSGASGAGRERRTATTTAMSVTNTSAGTNRPCHPRGDAAAVMAGTLASGS